MEQGSAILISQNKNKKLGSTTQNNQRRLLGQGEKN